MHSRWSSLRQPAISRPQFKAERSTDPSDSFFDGIEFTYQGPTTNPSANVYLFTPPGPAGTRGGGTLTLVSGTGPATIPYSAAENIVAPVLDANPADVIEDFLTNPQYSIGLTSDAIDSVSLQLYRTYCAAQGVFISPLLSDQEQMSQTVDRWASITNTLIFWSEGKLKFVPLGDSAITNTGITPNVAFEPNLSVAYDLTYDDYIDKGHHGRSGEASPPLQGDAHRSGRRSQPCQDRSEGSRKRLQHRSGRVAGPGARRPVRTDQFQRYQCP